MSAITLFLGGAPPDIRSLGSLSVPGLFSGKVSLSIVSGAAIARLAIYSGLVDVEVIDPVAFAEVASLFSPGWGSPSLLTVTAAAAPTTIFCGTGGTSDVLPPNSITSSAQPPFPAPAPMWNEVKLPTWMWTGAAPRPPFVRPKPIALATGAPWSFIALVSSDTGNPVTFEVTSS